MAAAATTWWRASTSPMTMAAQLRTAIDDSICRRVAAKTRRARRSARDRAGHDARHVRLLLLLGGLGRARWSGWRWCRR